MNFGQKQKISFLFNLKLTIKGPANNFWEELAARSLESLFRLKINNYL